ncbi:hypothetical protein GQ44DRAFT_770985 [Phaeosphaeriaceae sp. PMI808]|nr:hypothetical protein GQ44DRAFT_770985 [Phaeosphaeriaceae sp. PMI808]
MDHAALGMGCADRQLAIAGLVVKVDMEPASIAFPHHSSLQLLLVSRNARSFDGAGSSSTSSPPSSTGTTISIAPTPDTSSIVSKNPSISTISSSLPIPTACNPGGIQPKFLLLVSNPGTEYDGQYGIQDDSISTEVMTFGNVTSASVFTFNDKCRLVASGGNVANIPRRITDSLLYFDTPVAISENKFVPASCDIVNNALRCAVGAANTFYVCNGQPFLQIANYIPSTCGTPILRIIFT